MNKKGRKKLQKNLAQEAIHSYFSILNKYCKSNEPINTFKEFEKKYIKEIIKLQTSFNIKLSREDKLKICKKCFTYQTPYTQLIRLNPKLLTKEYICKNCGNIRRFKLNKK